MFSQIYIVADQGFKDVIAKLSQAPAKLSWAEISIIFVLSIIYVAAHPRYVAAHPRYVAAHPRYLAAHLKYVAAPPIMVGTHRYIPTNISYIIMDNYQSSNNNTKPN